MSDRQDAAHGRDADELATALGNRAGVVEWANEAFARLTGIPLADTVNKPVERLLARAGLDLEVVDFVAQHFFEGRPCRLEFPFERPDGRRIEVLLDVEALRDAMGEIDRFRATACERNHPVVERLESPSIRECESARATVPTSALRPTKLPPATRLTPAIHRALAAARRAAECTLPPGPPGPPGADAWLLDLALSAEPLAIRASDAALESLVTALLRAAQSSLALADHAWATITLTTGRTTPHRRFISQAHAIPASAPALSGERHIHLEVHDTGAPIAADALARLRVFAASASASAARSNPADDARGRLAAEHRGGSDVREEALLDAIRRATRLGASIHLDSTPGCGNQVLVLFPS